MFAITCKTKHVPQAIRNTLEMKGQCVPDTTVREFLNSMRESGLHEERIVSLLKSHGQVRNDIVFFRADNYQRLYNAVASASAKDPTRDTAHVVFTSAL